MLLLMTYILEIFFVTKNTYFDPICRNHQKTECAMQESLSMRMALDFGGHTDLSTKNIDTLLP